MEIDRNEKLWIALVLALVVFATAVVTYTALIKNIHPPSNVETIDSAALHLTEEFAEDALGVKVGADGSIRVTMVAARFGFYPQHITLPAGKPITFRWATVDVLHGVHAAQTNMNTMVVPGFVSQITTVFNEPGEYPLLCNEYCGFGHDYMWSRIRVVPAEQWTAEQSGPVP